MGKILLIASGFIVTGAMLAYQLMVSAFASEANKGRFEFSSASMIAGKLAFLCAIAPLIIAICGAIYKFNWQAYAGIVVSCVAFAALLTFQSTVRYDYSSPAGEIAKIQEVRNSALDLTAEYNSQNPGVLSNIFPVFSETGEMRSEYLSGEEKILELMKSKNLTAKDLIVLKAENGDEIYARLKKSNQSAELHTLSIHQLTHEESQSLVNEGRTKSTTKRWFLGKE